MVKRDERASSNSMSWEMGVVFVAETSGLDDYPGPVTLG